MKKGGIRVNVALAGMRDCRIERGDGWNMVPDDYVCDIRARNRVDADAKLATLAQEVVACLSDWKAVRSRDQYDKTPSVTLKSPLNEPDPDVRISMRAEKRNRFTVAIWVDGYAP